MGPREDLAGAVDHYDLHFHRRPAEDRQRLVARRVRDQLRQVDAGLTGEGDGVGDGGDLSDRVGQLR